MTGEDGYRRYAKFTNNKTYDGREMPAWEALPEAIRGAWEAAMDEPAKRFDPVESGPLQFENDKPGVYFTARDATMMGWSLEQVVLTGEMNPTERTILKKMLRMLLSVNRNDALQELRAAMAMGEPPALPVQKIVRR